MVLVPLFFLLRSGEAKTLPPQLYLVLGLANINQGPIGCRGPGGDAAAKKFPTTATHCEIAPCPGIFFNIEKTGGHYRGCERRKKEIGGFSLAFIRIQFRGETKKYGIKSPSAAMSLPL